jgi:hypothetical protein
LSLIALSWLTAAGRPFDRVLSAVDDGFAGIEDRLAAIEDELPGPGAGGPQIVVIHKEFEASLPPFDGIQVHGLTHALRVPSEMIGTLLQASCQPVSLEGFLPDFRARWISDGQDFELCNSDGGPLHNDAINLPVQGGESVSLECFTENTVEEQHCVVQLHLWLELERAE